MSMISTRNLAGMPGIRELRRLTRSLAMLDAILSPEWDSRYYSFDARWSDGEEMASMRNGEGDHWFALFTSKGVALHGLAHEAAMFRPDDPWPGIFAEVPDEFAGFVAEPAFDTQNSTFCIWRRSEDTEWVRGRIQFPEGEDPDGSAYLLRLLDGEPGSYREFAAWYYEVDLPLASVEAVYRHAPITDVLLRELKAEVNLADLARDIDEIGYPEVADATR